MSNSDVQPVRKRNPTTTFDIPDTTSKSQTLPTYRKSTAAKTSMRKTSVAPSSTKAAIRGILVFVSFFIIFPHYIFHNKDHSLEKNHESEQVIETLSSQAQEQEQEVITSDKKSYPLPSEATSLPDVKINVKPLFGEHQANQDVVFAFAEGYPLDVYVFFLTSLNNCGFRGDVVLSVSHVDKMEDGVYNYLKNSSTENVNVVVYSIDWKCQKKNGDQINHANGGFSDCTADLYSSSSGIAVKDPRSARPVATARYEVYWIWSTKYERNSRMLIIDSRDSYFQLNPFDHIPTPTGQISSSTLYLFEENRECTSISKSNYNRRWISHAYGQEALSQIKDEAVICSGSTMGDQPAIESYLRAMVMQYDDTECKMVGCDQGFHNYIYYHHKLDDVDGIDKIVVYKQGEGAINNLAALRIKTLKEWNILKDDMTLLNWDGSVSPVAHQFDRDKELNNFMKAKKRGWVSSVQK